MPFITDQQTIDDLRLFAKRGEDSIYNIFCRTATRNGAALLEEMFRYPLSDPQTINERSRLFRFFSTIPSGFPFQADLFDIAEHYLSVTDERTRLSGDQQTLGQRLTSLVSADNEYKDRYKGITALVKIMQDLQRFVTALPTPSPYDRERSAITTLLSTDDLEPLLKEGTKIPHDRMVTYDSLLRFRHREPIRRLLQSIYQLDVYFSVATAAAGRGFSYPHAFPAETHRIHLEGIYHPLVPGAVPNTLEITPANHILFLTGANMAGKSTFMKTTGIVLFLAHMGFPVPAASMEFSVLDGIFTTINLPDDLGMGVSHFYAEVQRIKKIAQQLHQGKKLFVIFDELFRGTNVKDAYEATIALTRAFANRNDSFLLLSTHIIEAGEVLATQQKAMDFIYLPTRIKGTRPVYTYQLEKGITSDRHGMVIIGNEGIFEILRRGKTKTPGPPQPAAASHPETFSADRQTLDDLNLTGKYKPGSVYSLFNKVQTEGAERLLDAMFQHPLSDPDEINRRSNRFLYLQQKSPAFPFTRDQLLQVEEYLRLGAHGNQLATTTDILRLRLMESLVKDQRYEQIKAGIEAVAGFITTCKSWFEQLDDKTSNPIRSLLDTAQNILADPRLSNLPNSFSGQQVARFHYTFGTAIAQKISQLCEILYQLDLGITIGQVARQRNFTYALALPKEESMINITGLHHPAIEKAVGNTITMDRESNLIFLTGANMAGKSTLMKSFGIAVYLAHMGFPVAATEMVFSVKDGLYTSINVPDDLNRGHSHFYAEAMRVKEAAIAISEGRQLVVIFDELFKGTNVRDAYDATLAVTAAFSDYRNCFFIISTHIIEVGEALKKGSNLQFTYLPTIMEGHVPRYTYRLQTGITSDRHGMRIIENEGILELF